MRPIVVKKGFMHTCTALPAAVMQCLSHNQSMELTDWNGEPDLTHTMVNCMQSQDYLETNSTDLDTA